jgi:hypothetical protein
MPGLVYSGTLCILPVLFPHRTVIMPPYINVRLVFLMESKRALCEARNVKQKGQLPWIQSCFVVIGFLWKVSWVNPHTVFDLMSFRWENVWVWNICRCTVTSNSEYSHIQTTVNYRLTSCWLVHDKKLGKCARQQICHVQPQENRLIVFHGIWKWGSFTHKTCSTFGKQ